MAGLSSAARDRAIALVRSSCRADITPASRGTLLVRGLEDKAIAATHAASGRNGAVVFEK
jgi:hypothetical protein